MDRYVIEWDRDKAGRIVWLVYDFVEMHVVGGPFPDRRSAVQFFNARVQEPSR